jgi:hypothetical protein
MLWIGLACAISLFTLFDAQFVSIFRLSGASDQCATEMRSAEGEYV